MADVREVRVLSCEDIYGMNDLIQTEKLVSTKNADGFTFTIYQNNKYESGPAW